MAIRIELSRERWEAAVRPFGLGPLEEARGLPQGSINTNCQLRSPQGVFLARLSTVRSEADLAFEATLLEELRRGGLPVVPPLPRPPPDKPWLPLEGGLLSIFPWVAGEELGPAEASETQLHELGRILGRVRRVASGSALRRANPYGPATIGGWLAELTASDARGDPAVREALPAIAEALRRAGALEGAELGIVHADVFRDNVLWLGDRISAVIDFEMACTAPWALEPAVAMLDWCWGPGPGFDARRVRAFAEGYRESSRPAAIDPADLGRCLAFAAARFTLSRLRDFHFSPLPPARLAPKDWREMRARLEAALAPEARTLCELWG